MKRIPLLLILLTAYSFSFAAPKIKAIDHYGSWNANSTWDLGRKPQHGDTVLIPAGLRVVVENNINLSSSSIYIKVSGILELDGGKLRLGNSSTVFLTFGAIVLGQQNSDRITIGNDDKFRGSDGLLFAFPIPYVANSTTGAGFVGVTLPVKYLGFSVARKNNDVLVQWATAEEQNADFYEIERSTDGTSWSVIGRAVAAGTTSSATHYSYTDRNIPAATVHYRVKQVDADGRFTYTPIRSVKREGTSSSVNVAAINGQVVLQFDQEIKSAVAIQIVATNGQVLAKRTVNRPAGQVVIDGEGAKGIYVVSITTTQGLIQATKIVL